MMKFKKRFSKDGCLSQPNLGTCTKDKCQKNGKSTPLSQQCKTGRFTVCKINGDRKHCAKLAALGFFPGNEMELICPEDGNACIVKILGGNITIDKETSKQILVSNS